MEYDLNATKVKGKIQYQHSYKTKGHSYFFKFEKKSR